MTKFHITKKGYEKIQEEIKNLKFKERPVVVDEIAAARELGDLSENAEYHAAKEKQGFIETRIKDLEDKVARSEIIDPIKLQGPKIKFGASVVILDCDTELESKYIIAGEYEAKIEKQIISILSPLARGLIGKSVGDEVYIKTPSGAKTYEVISVYYQEFEV